MPRFARQFDPRDRFSAQNYDGPGDKGSPRCCASSADMILDVKMRSFACDVPINRDKRCVPPALSVVRW